MYTCWTARKIEFTYAFIHRFMLLPDKTKDQDTTWIIDIVTGATKTSLRMSFGDNSISTMRDPG